MGYDVYSAEEFLNTEASRFIDCPDNVPIEKGPVFASSVFYVFKEFNYPYEDATYYVLQREPGESDQSYKERSRYFRERLSIEDIRSVYKQFFGFRDICDNIVIEIYSPETVVRKEAGFLDRFRSFEDRDYLRGTNN